MKSYRPIRSALSAFTVLLSLIAGVISSSAMAASHVPLRPQDLLRQMATANPDDCTPLPSASSADLDSLEERLFESVDTRVAERLNVAPAAQASEAESRARSALLEVERLSLDINKSWPSEDRFHFEITTLHPAILVRMYYRGHARLVLFGSYYFSKFDADVPGTKWGPVYADSDPDLNAHISGIELYPLHRGPSGRLRFLTRVWRSGCAGSIGEEYYGYEWNAAEGNSVEQIINIEGAEGLDEAASKPVGKLSTKGPTIQLPYCFFSSVDTWDNPTLCAADSFDLSGDDVHFVDRIYNAPDLAVVNNAIQHAQARDYVALRGYCASDAAAARLIREIPPFLHADDLKVVKTHPGRETVVFEDSAVHFDLVKRRGGWLLESFRIAADR